MATSAEIGLAALGAFAASEASGVTDVTSLGRGGDRSGDEGGGDTPAGLPGLGALQAQIGGLRGAVARAGVNQPSGGDASQLDLAAAFEQAVERGAGSVDVADPNQNLTRTVEVVRDVAGGDVPSVTGGGGSGGGVVSAITNFDPSRAGQNLGRGTGAFVNNAARGAGRGVGRAPFSFADAANAGIVSGAGDLVNNSAARGERAAENILSVATPGDDRLATSQEVIRGEADLTDATFGPLKWAIDAAGNANLGDAASDLASDGRLDEPILGGDNGSRDRDPTGGGANAATGSTSPSIARNADEAAAGGDPAGDPSTTSSDMERDDALDDVRRAAAAGRRRIGVIR